MHVGLIFAAGFFTWLWLRRHDLSWPAAATGAVAFMLGGSVVQTAGSFIGQAVVCMPFVMWLTSRFVSSPTTARGAVMSGDLEIRMGYRPPGFASGSIVSLAALAIVAVLAVGGARRGRESALQPRLSQ